MQNRGHASDLVILYTFWQSRYENYDHSELLVAGPRCSSQAIHISSETSTRVGELLGERWVVVRGKS